MPSKTHASWCNYYLLGMSWGLSFTICVLPLETIGLSEICFSVDVHAHGAFKSGTLWSMLSDDVGIWLVLVLDWVQFGLFSFIFPGHGFFSFYFKCYPLLSSMPPRQHIQ